MHTSTYSAHRYAGVPSLESVDKIYAKKDMLKAIDALDEPITAAKVGFGMEMLRWLVHERGLRLSPLLGGGGLENEGRRGGDKGGGRGAERKMGESLG